MQSQNLSSEASLSTKARVWWSSLPLAYKTISTILLAIYLSSFVNPLPISTLCNWPEGGISRWYTWLSSSFLHNNFGHILMNALSFSALGPAYERKVGSLGLTVHSVLFALYGGALHFVIATFGDQFLPMTKFLGASLSNTCGIGFSGVLFSMWGVRAYEPGAPDTESVFGLFVVPSWISPWVTLAMIQFMIPHASFLGHLAGLIVGIGCMPCVV